MEVAAIVGRSYNSIKSLCTSYGIAKSVPLHGWSPAETEQLRTLRQNGESWSAISQALGGLRSPEAVRKKSYLLPHHERVKHLSTAEVETLTRLRCGEHLSFGEIREQMTAFDESSLR